jgi:hypothetical protein
MEKVAHKSAEQPFEKSVEAPVTAAISTAEDHRKYCKPCEKQFIIYKIQDYLTRISNLCVSKRKLQLVVDMFTFIEEKIPFLCSSDFSDNHFVTVIYLKSIEIQDQVKNVKVSDEVLRSALTLLNENADISDELRQAAITLLTRVNKKIHLYRIKSEICDDV